MLAMALLLDFLLRVLVAMGGVVVLGGLGSSSESTLMDIGMKGAGA